MKSKGADTLRSEVVDEVVIEGPGVGGFEVIVPIEIVAGALLSVPLQGRFEYRLQIIYGEIQSVDEGRHLAPVLHRR